MQRPNRREFLTLMGAGAASALLPAGRGHGAEAPGRRPNVILVMTDDQGYGDLGCLGNTIIQTPNLDAFHKQCTRLTNFHVDPTCSPTRSALMTGRYSSRTGVWHTIMGRSLLRADEVTVADVFRAGGYATGIFGKWHLGDNYPFRPQDRGFTETLCHGGGGVGQTPDWWGNDYFDDTYWHNGVPKPFKGYCTDVFFDGALRFIEASKDRPFLCYIPTNAPHGPFNVAKKYEEIYTRKGVRGGRAKFWGMITNIDENMGRLLAKLKEWGLEENTIVIFMTDNGTAGGLSGGRRGGKGSEFDGGHRVPFFIRWPGAIEAGRDLDRLAAHIDVLPTLVELCGLKRPEKVQLDGASLVPLLTGDAAGWADRTLFVHSQRIEHPQKWRKCAVMTQRWRLVGARRGPQLFDMAADPEQKKDVAKDDPDVVEKLRKAYDAWWDGISTRFDEYCRIVVGHERENPARLTGHDWHGGRPPWNQGHIRNTKQHASGFWAVEVARAGRYEITLRQMPTEAGFPIQGDEAWLRIGGIEATKPIPQGATGVAFALDLKPCKTKLETRFTDKKTGKSRGAYFAYVRRVSG